MAGNFMKPFNCVAGNFNDTHELRSGKFRINFVSKLGELQLIVGLVLVIPWQRGKFGINFPRKFTKSEISRAQRGKFDFLNLRGKLIPKFPERAWDSWLIPQLSILIIWKFKNYLTHRKQNIQESWMGWNHKTGHLFWTPNLLYMH